MKTESNTSDPLEIYLQYSKIKKGMSSQFSLVKFPILSEVETENRLVLIS